jgi:DNA-binding transcriptional MerR regulator
MRLKKLYSSREVASLTGLSARQLQWWDEMHLLRSSVPSHRTEAGGFTERRYSSVELLELMVLADLRRRGFSVGRIRRLIDVLKSHFKVRLFEAIEGGGPITLFIDGGQIYARAEGGAIYNVLENASQPMLMLGEDVKLRQLVAREGKKATKTRRAISSGGSEKSSRAPRRGAE